MIKQIESEEQVIFRYGKAKLIDGVTRIKDGIVNEFLIEGSKKAVLFDTGLDLFNIKDYVAKLTAKELVVVNSHFHPDHANGNHHFKKVYIGEKDLPTFTTKDVYFKLVDDIVTATYAKYPKTRKLEKWVDKLLMTKKGETEYVPLKDGDEIDLGDKTLIVKDFPGHTPGSITLLDTRKSGLSMRATRAISTSGCSRIPTAVCIPTPKPDSSIITRSPRWATRVTAVRTCR
ncbi:MAG: MBL fold metallo-hydrolase [Clostridia bacterium]|nr:MBL fold metallo-hydrolase [Clostridia bacterium]